MKIKKELKMYNIPLIVSIIVWVIIGISIYSGALEL
jgi:hypothetical protein